MNCRSVYKARILLTSCRRPARVRRSKFVGGQVHGQKVRVSESGRHGSYESNASIASAPNQRHRGPNFGPATVRAVCNPMAAQLRLNSGYSARERWAKGKFDPSQVQTKSYSAGALQRFKPGISLEPSAAHLCVLEIWRLLSTRWIDKRADIGVWRTETARWTAFC